MYINCHTFFSFKFATLSVEQLIEQAVACGVKHLALTDINNTSAALDFYRLCREHDIHPVLGIEFRQNNQLRYIALAENAQGWYELNHWLTQITCQKKEFPHQAPLMEHVFFIYPIRENLPTTLRPDEFLGIHYQEIGILRLLEGYPSSKLVALHPVSMQSSEDFLLHQVLQAIDQNTLLSRLETIGLARPSDYMRTITTLQSHYGGYTFLLDQAETLLSRCQMGMDLSSNKNKQLYSYSREDDFQLLQKLSYEGFQYRYGEKQPKTRQRLHRELQVIHRLGFTANYLIVWDIIRYAQSRNYHWIGRGSAANSMVAYCLGITDVDPVALDLYFERFINPHRATPPDFDIDFSWDQRDDVLDYIFKRYGHGQVAFLGTYQRFKRDSALREVSKVFGLPKSSIDLLVRNHRPGLHQHPLAPDIEKLAQRLLTLPSHLSMHAGGILITEKPLNHYTALQMMPKGFWVTHFDMHVAEDYGFYKFDILSQRGLGHIKMAVNLIRKNRQEIIDIHRVQDFVQDPNVLEQLSKARVIGCFYVESPAMRQLLTRLYCRDYPTLVAASSVIRPGVARSGMMREYIQRHRNPQSVHYLHPVFQEHLAETYGVMVYQEDVMKIAHYFGGIALEDTDILRRAMSGKTRGVSNFTAIKEQFFSHCRKQGHGEVLIRQVWDQMESFAGYSFCKAHSASYAVESFQSLFLKTYYPIEFMVAVVNNFGGFYRTELYLHEARMAGATVKPPCINRSDHLTTLEGKDIYLGFIHVKGLEQALIETLMQERKKNGPYRHMADFIERVPVPRKQLDLLIRIGAFQFTGKSKQILLWEKNDYLQDHPTRHRDPSLFAHASSNDNQGLDIHSSSPSLPKLEYHPMEEVFEQIDLLGFPLVSPFDLLSEQIEGIRAAELMNHENDHIQILGYFITRKTVTTKQGLPMAFGTWIDREGQFFDTVHFPSSYLKYPMEGVSCYLLKGKVSMDFSVPTLEVDFLRRLPMIPDPRYQDI